MKKIFLLVLCVTLASSSFAAKPKKGKTEVVTVDPQQARLDSLKRAQEIRRIELQMQAEEAQMQAELEMAKFKAENARNSMAKRLAQKLFIPCVDESYDKTGVYMAGLGISEGEADQGYAKLNANRMAISDIATRYIGTIKNGLSQYSKNNITRTGDKVKENSLEGLAETVGQKVIDKYAEQVCMEFGQNDEGYVCYVAIHVPLATVVDETIDELGVLQNDYDREQFRNWMNQELNKQAAEKAAEKAELEELRKQML
jgi:hypothetical protein